MNESGMVQTGIEGIQLFKITDPIECSPAVYEPSVTAIVLGTKEAILDGNKHFYDNTQYICCTMPMPIEAGTPKASTDNPLIGVYISIDTGIMTELALEIQSATSTQQIPNVSYPSQSILTANWDPNFTDALYKMLLLDDDAIDLAILKLSLIHI